MYLIDSKIKRAARLRGMSGDKANKYFDDTMKAIGKHAPKRETPKKGKKDA